MQTISLQLLMSCLLSVDLQYTVRGMSGWSAPASRTANQDVVIHLKIFSIPDMGQGAASEGCAVTWFTYVRAHSRKTLASLGI